MSKSSTIEFPSTLRFEIHLLSAFLIVFGAVNQIGMLLYDFVGPLTLPFDIPAGAMVLPGGFLIIAGFGALLKHEWGFKLGCILCLIHLMCSAVPLIIFTSSGLSWSTTVIEFFYVTVCAAGVFESWRVLSLSRRITNRST